MLADDVGVCAIKTGGGGALLGSLVGMDVARRVRLGVVLHGIRGRQKLVLYLRYRVVVMSSLPALGAADHTEAFNKSQVKQRSRPNQRR